MKTRSALWTMLRLLVVLLIAIVVLFPVYIMVITSFKTSSQAFDMPPEFLPAPALFNYHADLVHSTYIGTATTTGGTIRISTVPMERRPAPRKLNLASAYPDMMHTRILTAVVTREMTRLL